MEKNPYKSPADDRDLAPEGTGSEGRFQFDWLYVPMTWAVLLFIIWTQHGMLGEFRSDIALWVKITCTICTALSMVALLFSLRGWRVFIALPLFIYLIWIQYLVWTFYANR